jgi:cyclopropane fatty-acyl-phospholipid synthase-like methyltransferase
MGTTGTIVAPSNGEQSAAWNGDQGRFWTEQADHFDDGVAGYHEPLMAACSLNEDMHVLDIGCGSGQTTRDAARAATRGAVLGVDLSS